MVEPGRTIIGRNTDLIPWIARLALKWAQEHDLGPFHVGCAYEALARVHAVAGDRAEFDRCLSAARECLARITDDEDARVLRDDLANVAQASRL